MHWVPRFVFHACIHRFVACSQGPLNIMTDAEFDQLVVDAVAALREKQARLQAEFDLAGLPRWHFDQQAEQLTLQDAHGHPMVVAEVIPMGSHSTASGLWKWAWCNGSLTPSLQDRALPLKGLALATGFPAFASEAPLPADEALAGQLAALGVLRLQAVGCYRAALSTGVHSYLALMSVRRVVQ